MGQALPAVMMWGIVRARVRHEAESLYERAGVRI